MDTQDPQPKGVPQRELSFSSVEPNHKQESGEKAQKTYGIYFLIDPVTQKVRYIGKSRFGSTKRLSHHLGAAKGGERSHKANWIRALLKHGRTPSIYWVDWSSSETEAFILEKGWIAYYQAQGAKLTNITQGGQGGCRVVGGTQRVDINLTPDQIIKLKKLALKQPIGLSELLRRIVDEYLKKE